MHVQVFPPIANLIARGSLLLLAMAVVIGLLIWYGLVRSEYVTEVSIAREQPVQFSHEHHVAQLGLDCRYCHTSVEISPFAGIPSTSICMNCHTEIWANTQFLAPVRASYETNLPLIWTRVHNLPDFVFFNHAIHVAKGVGCSTCHGRVDRMPLVWKTESLFMNWCLDCHSEPERFVRPRDRVFDMNYQPPSNQLELGRQLVAEYGIRRSGITDCNTCHR